MILNKIDRSFWVDKKIFLTGHTGFKGSWLAFWLNSMGAKIYGYSRSPITNPNLYSILSVESMMENSTIADVRDFSKLHMAIAEAHPDIVIHMAAQPLVRYSYANPLETYQTNVMGTLNLLEAMRSIGTVKASLIVTTDKCYENKEWIWGYRESDSMGGFDPYSSSKACAELITSAYSRSYFCGASNGVINSIATARAGNVIGGGDWSDDRLIPDLIKAFVKQRKLEIRNPNATRPWQHVLEPLSGYLCLIQNLYTNGSNYVGPWNFGPYDQDTCSVESLLRLMSNYLGTKNWYVCDGVQNVHEAQHLKLDCSKAHSKLNWQPRWSLDTASQKTVEWYCAYLENKNMHEITLNQIYDYQNE